MNDLKAATRQFVELDIDTPELDAKLLLAHALGITREELVLRGEVKLNEGEQQKFDELVKRRAAREPMSHILGIREFYGREFKVTSDVLDPRPDTETLITSVLESGIWNLESRMDMPNSNIPDSGFQILDIGTGSGCIIITLLKELPNANGVGIDISKKALEIAQSNAKNHDLEERLLLKETSMFDLLNNNNGLVGNKFDLIVSNPPYIPEEDIPHLMPEVSHFEPNLALNGGKDGLDCYRELAKSTGQLLKPNGLIFLEIGAGQTSDVVDIFSAESWQLQSVVKDLSGYERCVIFNRK